MKTLKYLSIFAACTVGLMSCEDDHNNFMVDDTIGLLNSGLVEVEVFDGVDDPLNFYAIKAGKGFQNAEVTISVDPTAIQEYNEVNATTFTELPAECYSISVASLSFSKEDYRKSFEIKWNREALKSALEANKDYVIPVRMAVGQTGVNVDESRLTALIHPTVEIPTLSLASYGYQVGLTPTRKTAVEEDVYMFVESNFIAQHDIDVKFAIDNSLIDQYNEEHDTEFLPLPEDAIRFETEGWTLKKYLNEMRMKFTFVREALVPENGSSKYGDYILPIRIVSATTGSTNYTLSEGKDYVLYTIRVVASEIDKSNWSIFSTSDNALISNDPDASVAKGDYGPEYLIDGTTSKYWRSVQTVVDEKPICPVEIVIDLAQERDLYRLVLNNGTGGLRRQNNVKAGTFSASLDGENFNEVGQFSFSSQSSPSAQAEVGPCRARYVKILITELLDDTMGSQLTEFTAYGE